MKMNSTEEDYRTINSGEQTIGTIQHLYNSLPERMRMPEGPEYDTLKALVQSVPDVIKLVWSMQTILVDQASIISAYEEAAPDIKAMLQTPNKA
jgi:hypothetical protein